MQGGDVLYYGEGIIVVLLMMYIIIFVLLLSGFIYFDYYFIILSCWNPLKILPTSRDRPHKGL